MKQGSIKQLRYPDNLSDITPNYLQMAIRTYDVYHINTMPEADKMVFTGTIGSLISLPIPVGLIDTTAAGWSDEKDANMLQELANQIAEMGPAKKMTGMTSHFGEKHSILRYSGIGAKVWNLFWEFVPQNENEAVMVEEIIKQFRRAQLPEKGVDIKEIISSQKYPNMLTMEIQGPFKKYQKFLPCFITAIAVDRSFDDTFIFYKNGTVPSIRLTMQITEISNYTKEIFDRLYGA